MNGKPGQGGTDYQRHLATLRDEVDRLQRRNRQLEEQSRALLMAVESVADTLSAEADLKALLRRVALVAVRLTGAQVGAIYLADAAGGLTVESVETAQVAESGLLRPLPPTEAWQELPTDTPKNMLTHIALGQGIAGHVAQTGEPILSTDVNADARIPAAARAIEQQTLGLKPESLLALPMVFQGTVTGALEVAKGVGAPSFDVRSLDVIRTLAALAAVAVSNAQLAQQAQGEHDRILQIQEDERKRLNHELHDGPAQRLAQIDSSLSVVETLLMRDPAKALEEVRAIRELAARTTTEMRTMLFVLDPRVLDTENGGLVVALDMLVKRIQTANGPHIRLDTSYSERRSHAIELAVFAIVQEAVNNALKHARAHTCVIELRETPTELIAVVRDDGQGFDMRQVMQDYEQRDNWGLLSMHDRAGLIGGKLAISSQPGRGTVVTLEVPR
ncbi:MAG TPA: GAF domain-containing sensor histidine kinase [Ktedonobacterales bacterium]|nr:GAF domain-containing sensor histidine kinase [Ktedonobacterales bacterium]